MDSLSTELIAQLYRNQPMADGCNERHFILVLDMKQQKKKKIKKERKETEN